MKMSDEISLPVAQEVAWQALNDIDLLRSCIPGCEAINPQEDGGYEVIVSAAVGPIRARFKGEMRMHDVVAPSSYRLEFNMQGGTVGFGRGGATVELLAVDEQTTLLKYTATASVGGKLAQIGARLIDITAKKMAAQFFEAFRKKLAPDSEPQDAGESTHATLEPTRSSEGGAAGSSDAGKEKARSAHPISLPGMPEGVLVIKLEVTLIDKTESRYQRSRLRRCWDALMGR